MRSWPHASLALWIAAAGLWSPFVAFLGLHLITPSDGARLQPLVTQSVETGLLLEPLTPGSLQPGDRLLAVDGQSVESFARDLSSPGQASFRLAFGQTVTYTIERAGVRRDVSITLGPYPIGAVLAANWGSIATAIIFQLATAFILMRRPAEPVARVMFLTAAAIVSATNWSLGLQVSDLLGKVGFWLYELPTTLAYMLIWASALHSVLLFPTAWPPLARRRWMVVLLYAMPYVAMAFVTVLVRDQNALAWAKRSNQAVGYVEGCYVLLALVAAMRSFRSARDPVSRAQVHWVMTAFVITFFFNIAFGVIPEIALGHPLLSWDVQALLGLIVPLAMGVAILRYHLFEIDVILNRTLVYGLLTSIVVGLYVGAVGSFDALVRSGQPLAPLLLATILTLFILRPLRAGLQRGANRLVPAPAHMAPPGPAAPAGEIPASAGAASAPGRQPPDVHEKRHGLGRGTLAASLMAWGLLLLSMLLVVAGLLLGLRVVVVTQGDTLLSFAGGLINAGTITAFAVAGALIALRQPRNRIGWLFGAVGLFLGLTLFSDSYSSAGRLTDWQVFLPGLNVVRWLNRWIWIPAVVLPATFILLLFPDGRLPSARWRPIAWSAGLALAGYILAAAFDPSPGAALGPGANPFGNSAVSQLKILYPAVAVLLVVGTAGSVAAVVVRFWRSHGIERQQFKWLVYAAVFGFVLNLLATTLGIIWPQQMAALSDLLIGLIMVWLIGIVAAASIAILRYHLYDIDVLINRTLVYGALTLFIVGLYVLVVGVSGELLHQTGSLVLSLLVTGLIAILFQPLRERLQRFVNRLLYGERDDPYAVLSRLGRQLEATLAPEAVLPTLVETIAQTLKLPYVAVAFQSDGESEPQIAAAHGLPADNAVRLPLTYQSECVGELRVAPRGPGETFTAAEQRLLADIANRAGVAVHAVRLTADLLRSRERLVTAREEERRRLRRDLHDGLGPQLASQTLTLTAARQLLRQSPDQAEALLAAAIQHAQDAVTDIRRVVYDLRPPALDDLGLVGALRAQAAEYEASGVRFSVSVPESLPPLPAAVEVACYRIVQEALTNVVKHANARHCAVTLALDGALHLEIRDDGRGLPDNRRAGVGLTSMRERAEELGGHCLVEPGAGGGTRVRASLPMG